MRSVRLYQIPGIYKKLSSEDFDKFKTNEEKYKQMWIEQTQEFWVKFAISLRTYIKTNSSLYDENCEKEMVAYLKALTHKNFSEINNYVKHAAMYVEEAEKCITDLREKYDTLSKPDIPEKFIRLRLLTMKLNCAGSFVEILSYFEGAEAGNEIYYIPPEEWFQPVKSVEPFESYLRSKWGGHPKVEEILGCKRENIKWWKSPAKKADKLEQMKATNVLNPNSEIETVEYFRPADGYHLYGLEGEDDLHTSSISCFESCCCEEPEYDYYDNSSESSSQMAANLEYHLSLIKHCWLPEMHSSWVLFHDKIDKELIDFTWSENPLFKLWPLMEHSFPPLLDRKFHVVNTKGILEKGEKKQNLAIVTWFIQWAESFGHRYMNFVQQSRDNLAKRTAVPDVVLRKKVLEEWKAIRDNDKNTLEIIKNKKAAPHEIEDSVKKSGDFLLEPCVLIQLPWQPVMFRQWLAAALIEIQKFEVESLELRHWPLTKELEPIARELLMIVGDLKERILIGWTILSIDATMYPQDSKKHPHFILDRVILPSLEALELLCSKRAFQIVENIKKTWTSNESFEGKVNLPKNAYSINKVLSGFSVLFFGHYSFWKKFNTIRDPFPTVQLTQELGLENQLHQIENEKEPVLPPDENEPFYLSQFSVDEERLLTILQNANSKLPDEYLPNANLDKAKRIFSVVISGRCSHFSKEKLDTLLSILDTDEAKEAATNIFDDIEEIKTPLQQIILSSVIYYDISEFLYTIDGKNSIMAWILRTGAQITEREQIIRIIAACSILLNETPRLCSTQCPASSVHNFDENTDHIIVEPMGMSEMSKALSEVREKEKNITREVLWSKFPESWRKPVDLEIQTPSLHEGLPTIVSSLEIRLGRIIWNAGQQNFIENDKGGVPYPDAHLVQYLLPCYFTLLIEASRYPDTERNKTKKYNLINFLANLVKIYESSYQDWTIDSSPRFPKPSHPFPQFNSDEMKRKRIIGSYLLEATSYALHGYTGIGRLGMDLDPLSQFHIISRGLLEYPMYDSHDVTSKIQIYNCQTWLTAIYPHLKMVHELCYKIMKIPSPAGLLTCPALKELYLASAIVHQLEVLSSVQEALNLELVNTDTEEQKAILQISEALRCWRYILFCIIFETEKSFKYPANMIETFVEGEGKMLILQVLNHIKMFRDRLRITKRTLHRFDIPIFVSHALKRYNEMYFSNHLNSLKLFREEVTLKALELKRQIGAGLRCSMCSKPERLGKEYVACQACIDQGSALIHYFCSQKCQLRCWEGHHMTKHIEIAMGLCPKEESYTINISAILKSMKEAK